MLAGVPQLKAQTTGITHLGAPTPGGGPPLPFVHTFIHSFGHPVTQLTNMGSAMLVGWVVQRNTTYGLALLEPINQLTLWERYE